MVTAEVRDPFDGFLSVLTQGAAIYASGSNSRSSVHLLRTHITDARAEGSSDADVETESVVERGGAIAVVDSTLTLVQSSIARASLITPFSHNTAGGCVALLTTGRTGTTGSVLRLHEHSELSDATAIYNSLLICQVGTGNFHECERRVRLNFMAVIC